MEQSVLWMWCNRWYLPRFNNGNTNNNIINLFTWQAQSMSNYLQYLLTKNVCPLLFPYASNIKEGEYDNNKNDIKPHHVKQLYGVMMTRRLQGSTLDSHMYNLKRWFKHNEPAAVDSMPCGCLQDLIQLLHFIDD